MERGSQLVAFEITLSVGQLVKKYGQVLTYAGWDMVMDILSLLLKNPEVSKKYVLYTLLPNIVSVLFCFCFVSLNDYLLIIIIYCIFNF